MLGSFIRTAQSGAQPKLKRDPAASSSTPNVLLTVGLPGENAQQWEIKPKSQLSSCTERPKLIRWIFEAFTKRGALAFDLHFSTRDRGMSHGGEQDGNVVAVSRHRRVRLLFLKTDKEVNS